MKKGFTLIELLAGIVILAIIALIATPIVLNIIDDSKESSGLRSAEFYLDAVEFSIANFTLNNKNIEDGDYKILKNGNICLKYNNDNNCIETLEVELKGEKPNTGTIAITNGEISGLNIMLNEKEITKNSKGEIVYVKTLNEVCNPAKEQKYTTDLLSAGYKYECKVDPNREPYTFYVLTTPTSTDTRINLIMERNINSDGTPATKAITKANAENGIYSMVEWINKDDYLSVGGNETDWDNSIMNNKGPITAMHFLDEATKNWTNINEMTINSFTDETGAVYETKIYKSYARMPYRSEVSSFDSTKNNGYLFEYLDGSDWDYDESAKPTNNIIYIYGYWTLSIRTYYPNSAWRVRYLGAVDICVGNYSSLLGVRPVITLKI